MGKAQTDGVGLRLYLIQGAVIKPTAIAQTVATGPIAYAWHKEQGGLKDFCVLGFGNVVGIFFHGTTWVPRMKSQGFGLLVHDGQSNAPAQGMV